MQILLVLALVFASFVALFALQNAQTVPIRFFTWERETSIAVIALAAAAVGALSATLAGMMRQLAMGLRQRQLKGELARAQKALESKPGPSDSMGPKEAPSRSDVPDETAAKSESDEDVQGTPEIVSDDDSHSADFNEKAPPRGDSS